MGRTKLYDREALLDAAMTVFWQRGYADTSLQQLERATGVNKSGLYSEFKDKEDLFLSSLRHYIDNRESEGLLVHEPLGWGNVEALLRKGPMHGVERKGCFAINSMREFESLPPQAMEIVAASQSSMLGLLIKNIEAEKTSLPAKQIAEVVLIFFSGLCMEMNMSPSQQSIVRKVGNFMTTLKAM